jgi:hypothetical protein
MIFEKMRKAYSWKIFSICMCIFVEKRGWCLFWVENAYGWTYAIRIQVQEVDREWAPSMVSR